MAVSEVRFSAEEIEMIRLVMPWWAEHLRPGVQDFSEYLYRLVASLEQSEKAEEN